MAHRALSAVAIFCALALMIGTASAANFTCGLFQRLHFCLPTKYNLALAWDDLPHTTPGPGAVVVQRRRGRALGGGPGGHVSRIERVISECQAIVTDNRGTYKRDICKNLVAYVRPWPCEKM